MKLCCICESCIWPDMELWSVLVYLLGTVDPCAPAGVLDCAPGWFSVRCVDCAIVCVVLAYATGRALVNLGDAVWLATTTPVVEDIVPSCWLRPAAASTRLLPMRPRRVSGTPNT